MYDHFPSTLDAEIHAKEKNFSAAIALLRETVVTEDALNYNEPPPDWFFSVRHHLGAVLMKPRDNFRRL